MWTPADITALPTAQDLIDAQSAIKEVKIELKAALLALEQAQLRVNRIRQDLWERRAWIAPIRKLSSDVLSLVFEFCGEDNWKTPLRIAGVSKQWRNVVLATPRAWAFLDVHKCSGHGEAELLQHFFKHSGQRPLHVQLHRSQRLTILSDVIERLECLFINSDTLMDESPPFPKLERLLLGIRARIAASALQITRFPALRELTCELDIEGDVPSMPGSLKPTFPPLRVLSVTTGDSAWLDLLTACRNTLVSLSLYFVKSFPPTTHLVLPMLKYLEITLLGPDPDSWPMDLKTPLLEAYSEDNRRTPKLAIPLHQDTGSVRQMRLGNAPDFLTASLRTLQLWLSADINKVLSQLQSGPDICPSLELIEVDRLRNPTQYEDSLAKVNGQRSQPISLKNVDFWHTPLPFAIVESPVSIQFQVLHSY
jgi:hypothetical protein